MISLLPRSPARLYLIGTGLALTLSTACGSAALQRKVEFPLEPTLASGPARLRTVTITPPRFTPASPSGNGSETWPPETLQRIEARLLSDLAAQRWLGVRTDSGAELEVQLSCTYKAELERSSRALWAVPAGGILGAAAGGLLMADSQTRSKGQTLLVAGTVVSLLGVFAAQKAMGPPSVREESLGCAADVRDALDRTVFKGQHTFTAREAGGLARFLDAAERQVFAELQSGIEGGLRTAARQSQSQPGLGSIAVLDLEAGSVMDEAQRAMAAKLVAAEIQALRIGKVIGVEDVRAMLGLDKLKLMVGCADDSCIADLGGALGVDRLVAGGVTQVGPRYIMELRLMHVASVTVEQRTNVESASLSQLFAAIPGAVRQLLRR